MKLTGYLHIVLVCVAGAGCTRHQEKVIDTAEADALFEELCSTYRAYTDTLRLAGDTLSIPVEERLDEALRKVYARYTPDLDTHLSEAQNDTLWSLTQAYMKLRNNRGTHSQPEDTVVAEKQP